MSRQDLHYLRRLTENYAFRFRLIATLDEIPQRLALDWPQMPRCENQALRLWQVIGQLVYPLTLKNPDQELQVTVTVSGTEILPPELPEGEACFSMFDAVRGRRWHHWLLPGRTLPPDSDLRLGSGLTVLASLRNYYHIRGGGAMQPLLQARLLQAPATNRRPNASWPVYPYSAELIRLLGFLLTLMRLIVSAMHPQSSANPPKWSGNISLPGLPPALLALMIFIIMPRFVQALQKQLLKEATQGQSPPQVRVVMRRAAFQLDVSQPEAKTQPDQNRLTPLPQQPFEFPAGLAAMAGVVDRPHITRSKQKLPLVLQPHRPADANILPAPEAALDTPSPSLSTH